MISFALLALPIFGVVALGWAAVRTHQASRDVLDALGAYSFRFALPALVFRLIGDQPLDRSFNLLFCGGYLASGCLVFTSAFAFTRVLSEQPVNASGARAAATTVSNLGFLGPPLMLAFFGERGAAPLAMAILAEIMVLLSIGTVVMSVSHGAGVSAGALVTRSTIRNPVVVAIVLGAALAATGVSLPAPVDRLLEFLGASAGPTALFALGGTLALQRVDRATALAATGITAAKLVLYPVVAWCLLDRVLHVNAFWVQAGVLMASLPTAGNVYVVAQRYAADAKRVSAAIVLSTLVSVVTVPITAWLMLH